MDEFNQSEGLAHNSAKKLPRGKPFEKGDERINRGGRPKKKITTEAMEEMLEEKLNDPVERQAFKEAMWAKLIGKGVVSTMLLQQVQDRTEGKIVQPVDVSGSIDIGSILESFRKRK